MFIRNISADTFLNGVDNNTFIVGYSSGAFSYVDYAYESRVMAGSSYGQGRKLRFDASQDTHGNDTEPDFIRNPTAGHTGAVIRPNSILALPIYIY